MTQEQHLDVNWVLVWFKSKIYRCKSFARLRTLTTNLKSIAFRCAFISHYLVQRTSILFQASFLYWLALAQEFDLLLRLSLRRLRLIFYFVLSPICAVAAYFSTLGFGVTKDRLILRRLCRLEAFGCLLAGVSKRRIAEAF